MSLQITSPEQNGFIFKQSATEQFKNHPTLRSVARQELENYLNHCLEPHSLTLDTLFHRDTRFVDNTEPRSFLDAFLQAFTEGRCIASTEQTMVIPVNAEGKGRIDPGEFQLALEELCETLISKLQQQLLDYWQQAADNGMSRWQWLSEALKDACASNINDALHQSDRDLYYALTGLVIQSEKAHRKIFNDFLRPPAYLLQFTLNDGADSLSLIHPALVVTDKSGTVLIQPSGLWKRFNAEADCIQSVAQQLQLRWDITSLRVSHYEPEADIFDELARVLIDQQLVDLELVQIPLDEIFEGAEQQFDRITDPLRLLASTQRNVHPSENIDKHLPQWLKDADAYDRRTYRRYVSAMAATHLEYDGATFFTNLTSIRDFAFKALVDQMSRDGHEPVNPDDIQLNIKVAYGVPGGWGGVETTRLGVVDFALENLAGLPGGTTTVKGLNQRVIPAWMTPEYLKVLIQSVDIGRTYPAYLKQHLLDNQTEAQSRQQLFAIHLRNQLPLQALEAKLKGTHGFDADGAALIMALADGGDAAKHIVVSPLQLRLGPVLNMFVIAASDRSDAPVIIYRPFYSPSLIQYPSRSHLEQAIQADLPLRKSIHDWYKAPVRHTGLLGANEIRLRWELETASPLQGDVFQHLYEANSWALVELADRQSVSNAESRWANFKTLGWLIFESLLPLVTGPAATAGWLVQLAVSLKTDLQALSQSDGQDKSFAVADLLLNLAAVLMHAGRIATGPGQGASTAHPSVEPEVVEYPIESPVPDVPDVPDVPIIENRSLASEQHPQVDLAITQNTWATPRSSLSLAQKALLDSFALEKPADLPEPVAQGRNKGLYRYHDKWHALVEGQFFRVSIEEGPVLIIDPVDNLRPGPFLTHDGQGRWTVDNKLYLRGGAPHKRGHDDANSGAPGPSRRAVADSSGFPTVIETEITPLPKRLYHYVNRDKLATIKATRSAFIDNSSNDAYGRPQRNIVGLYVTDLAPDSMPLQQLSETLFGKNRYNASSRANKIHAVLELDPTLYPEGSVKLYKLESPKLTDHIYVLRGAKHDLQLRIKASAFGTGTNSLVSVKEL
ncbi:dermonecrotic toxin domain-containing protein [Pseudomonas triticicola]|uniref:dermonecrotic toxin domain-containing protein n=1 Tax=Pseudomonas triticicola TaxID=2842345 RepID=UPI003EBB000F